MNLNKIALITLTLFILGCSSIDNLSNKIFSNPSDGITFFDKKLDDGLKATGGKKNKSVKLLRHLEKAKIHCKQFDKKAIYYESGTTARGVNNLNYERYKCVKV